MPLNEFSIGIVELAGGETITDFPLGIRTSPPGVLIESTVF
jgi:hypothetical protein